MKYLFFLALTFASASYADDIVRCRLSERFGIETNETSDYASLRNGFSSLMNGKEYVAQVSEQSGQISVMITRIHDAKKILRTYFFASSAEGRSVGVEVETTDDQVSLAVNCRTTIK